ncbi:hypothetical protein D9613_008689 [Agrocybe pediades]|uniref:Uncharacterized protein n=1 Tax=Agrocybe pediades TaxID=84607 RepID=A0A8H4QV04_9AGAR|nr:hypothetical protein D9613_008689 [Agrocybe pediades]
MLIYATVIYHFSLHNAGNAAPVEIASSSPSSLLLPQDVGMDFCPRTRLEIVWSCLATILAASWVSVHPNMPGPNESKLKKTIRRIELMFWAIITPELIIYWAMRQWYGARKLERTLREHHKGSDPFSWTKTHGFFLQMGGFVIQDHEGSRKVLGWESLLQHYKDGRIDLSCITETIINDHSKADGFGKSIAFIQTSWFTIQCVARFSVNGLSLTALELVTASLAVLSLIMYLLWWNKPFNAEMPIVIVISEAISAPHSDQSAQNNSQEGLPTTGILEYMQSKSSKFTELVSTAHKTAKDMLNLLSFKTLIRVPVIVCTYMISRVGRMLFESTDDLPNATSEVPTFNAIRLDALLANFQMMRASFLVATLFGALHCTGWSSKIVFHSYVASLLWKISSSIITGGPLTWTCLCYFHYAHESSEYGSLAQKVHNTWFMIFGSLTLASIPLYIVSRIVLLTVAFVELQHIPRGALSNIPWANILPSIH